MKSIDLIRNNLKAIPCRYTKSSISGKVTYAWGRLTLVLITKIHYIGSVKFTSNRDICPVIVTKTVCKNTLEIDGLTGCFYFVYWVYFRLGTLWYMFIIAWYFPNISETCVCFIYVICVCLRIVVLNTYCVFVLFFFVLFSLCCQFLWIVYFWFPLRYSLTCISISTIIINNEYVCVIYMYVIDA